MVLFCNVTEQCGQLATCDSKHEMDKFFSLITGIRLLYLLHAICMIKLIPFSTQDQPLWNFIER